MKVRNGVISFRVLTVAVLCSLAVFGTGLKNLPTLRHTSGTALSNPGAGADPVTVGAGSSYPTRLTGVSAVASDDVWAVGYYVEPRDGNQRSLIEHWNGSEWRAVHCPEPGNASALLGVTAISRSDVWAVGDTTASPGGSTQTLIDHWNGVKWVVVTSLNRGSAGNQLESISAAGPSQIWAVGFSTREPGDVHQTLSEHWTGSAWSIVPTIDGPRSSDLRSVSTISNTNAWSVGGVISSDGFPLIEHWNGMSWRRADSAALVPGQSESLFGLTKLSAALMWTVGTISEHGGATQTLTESWTGTHWNNVNSPSVGTGANRLLSVAAVNAGQVFAVGDSFSGSVQSSLIEAYNGASWSTVPAPFAGTGTSSLESVTSVPGTHEAWAVGFRNGGNRPNQTLIDHWNGESWKAISSPSAWPAINKLLSVTAVSGTDQLWAVGYSNDFIDDPTRADNQVLIEHWTGSEWKIVAGVNPTNQDNILRGVASDGADDVWAVGTTGNVAGGTGRTLTEHFNGVRWSLASSPNVAGGDNDLLSISTGYHGFDAVGRHCLRGVGDCHTLIEQYADGGPWSIVASPNVGSGNSVLTGASGDYSQVFFVGARTEGGETKTLWETIYDSSGVHAVSGADPSDTSNTLLSYDYVSRVGVGDYLDNLGVFETLAEFEDTEYPSQSHSSFLSSLNSVDSAHLDTPQGRLLKVVAVGTYFDSDSATYKTLVENNTGSNSHPSFQFEPSPNAGTGDNSLSGVALRSMSDGWSVGSYQNKVTGDVLTLAEHYDGSGWTVEASPNAAA